MGFGCSSSKSVDVVDENALQGTTKPRRGLLRGALRRRSEKVAPAPPDTTQRTLMVLGCDGAGKSTLVGAMRGKDLIDPTPTVGFDPHKCVFKGTQLRLFDVGGGKQIRGIWRSYYAEVHAAIFVVDAADPSRFDEARTLLHEAYQHEALAGKPLLLLANKQDLPRAAPAPAIAEALRLHELGGSSYHVAAGSTNAGAMALLSGGGEGVQGGVGWLLERVTAELAGLEQRVERQMAEEKARQEKAKEERKARLAAKRAAKEAAEAETAAAAAAAAGAAGSGADQGGGVGVAAPAPAPAPAAKAAPDAGAPDAGAGRTAVPPPSLPPSPAVAALSPVPCAVARSPASPAYLSHAGVKEKTRNLAPVAKIICEPGTPMTQV